MKNKVQVGRLAFRVEGDWWNAYWAPKQNSMEGAVHLGSIRMDLAGASQAVKDSFMETMQLGILHVINDSFGVNPTWGAAQPGPERERSGRA
jgi:hypothetical protein